MHWDRPGLSIACLREVVLVLSAYFLYAFGRDLVYQQGIYPAFSNAWQIVHIETTLGLMWEARLQNWLLAYAPGVIYFLNWFYVLGYWPVILPTGIYLYLRRREAYSKCRNVALITFCIALLFYDLYPLAPPRMLSTYGFLDTIKMFGPGGYDKTSDALFYNPYAAMPSLHFALAFIISLPFLAHERLLPRLLAATYLALMLACIVVTGNHYFADAIVAAAVVGIAYVLQALLRKLAEQARPRLATGRG